MIAFALLRGDGDNQLAIADQGFECRLGWHLAFPACHAAQLLLVVAVDDRQSHRAIALQLHRDGAGKFQGRSEQAGRYQQFAQQLAYRLRICLGRHHLVKGLIQLHQFAADLVVFE